MDDLPAARSFVADGGVTFTMLWDGTFRSWDELEVLGMPSAILYAADGTELGNWNRVPDESEILALIGG
jgi:hypothetical protein